MSEVWFQFAITSFIFAINWHIYTLVLISRLVWSWQLHSLSLYVYEAKSHDSNLDHFIYLWRQNPYNQTLHKPVTPVNEADNLRFIIHSTLPFGLMVYEYNIATTTSEHLNSLPPICRNKKHVKYHGRGNVYLGLSNHIRTYRLDSAKLLSFVTESVLLQVH
jgi:hypothetical protein